MKKDLFKSLTWEDVQEIWWETDCLLRSIPEDPGKWPEWAFNTSTRFGEALRILRENHRVLPPVEERYPLVLRTAEQVTSRQLTNSRDRENTIIRAFVSYRLHEEGYSYSEIGKMMKRDHSTITHLAHRMHDMLSLPGAYRWEVQQFKRFEEMLNESN